MDISTAEIFNTGKIVYEAAIQLRPVIPANKDLVNPDSHIWQEIPYPHEEKLVKAYVYLRELTRSGHKLGEADCDNVATILKYIWLLKETQVKAEPLIGRKGRKIEPSLIQPKSKEVLQQQIDILSDRKFTDNDRWQDQVMDFLRIHVDTLRKSGVLNINDIQELDAQIGYYQR